MTELQIKTQKKLNKMLQSAPVNTTPIKHLEHPIPVKKIMDCLTIELKTHVLLPKSRN